MCIVFFEKVYESSFQRRALPGRKLEFVMLGRD